MDNQKGVNIELIKGTLDDYIIKDKDKIVIGRFTITELDKENKNSRVKKYTIIRKRKRLTNREYDKSIISDIFFK